MSRASEVQNRTKIKLSPVSAPPLSWDKIGKSGPDADRRCRRVGAHPARCGPRGGDLDRRAVERARSRLPCCSADAEGRRSPPAGQAPGNTYSHNAQAFAAPVRMVRRPKRSGAGSRWSASPMRNGAARRVLLFKANAHLALAPRRGSPVLRAMVQATSSRTPAPRASFPSEPPAAAVWTRSSAIRSSRTPRISTPFSKRTAGTPRTIRRMRRPSCRRSSWPPRRKR